MKIEKGNTYYTVSFPTLDKRIGVPVVAEIFQMYWLDRVIAGTVKQGTAKLYQKKKKWFLAISLIWEQETTTNERIMGIDLGLRHVAVASVGTQSLFFSGSPVAFRRRRFASRRKKLGKAKKLQAIKKSKNKESRWMKEQNHSISRRIIDQAIANGVGVIRMEDLTDIRHTAKSKRNDQGRNLHSWSFYQLHEFIRYKAEMAGIRFELVNLNIRVKHANTDIRARTTATGLVFAVKNVTVIVMLMVMVQLILRKRSRV